MGRMRRGGLICGGGSGLSEPGYNGGRWRGGVWAGGGMKGLFLFCACKLIRLDASGLGVLGELCASLARAWRELGASLARVDSPARKGFAQRTQRTPRLERRSLRCPFFMWGLTTNRHEFSRMGRGGEWGE